MMRMHAVLQSRRELELRPGAQVLLTRSIRPRRGLVNGARGVVERFVGSAIRLPVVRFANVRARLPSTRGDRALLAPCMAGPDQRHACAARPADFAALRMLLAGMRRCRQPRQHAAHEQSMIRGSWRRPEGTLDGRCMQICM